MKSLLLMRSGGFRLRLRFGKGGELRRHHVPARLEAHRFVRLYRFLSPVADARRVAGAGAFRLEGDDSYAGEVAVAVHPPLGLPAGGEGVGVHDPLARNHLQIDAVAGVAFTPGPPPFARAAAAGAQVALAPL